MADARLGILLTADTGQAQKGLDDFNKALGDSMTKLKQFDDAGDGIGGGAKKGLTALESAFIDAIKPIDQLQAEISALQDEIGKTTEPAMLKKYNDQIGRLTTQMNNLKVVGFETTLGKVNNAAAAAAGTFQQKFTPGVNAANTVLNNTSRIFQDLPFGIIGVANNINPLVESFGRLKQVSADTGTSIGKTLLKSLAGPGGLALTFGLVTAAAQFAVMGFTAFTRGLGGTSEASKKAAEQLKKQKEAMDAIIQDVAKEVNQVQVLVQVLKNETLTRQQRVNAIKELERIAPEYFATLNAEKATVEDVTKAYDKYLGSIRRLIEGKVIEKQLLEVTEKRISLERELSKLGVHVEIRDGKVLKTINAIVDAQGNSIDRQGELNTLKKEENRLVEQLARLQPPDKIFKDPKVKIDKGSQNDIIQTAKFLESQFVFDPSITFNPFDTDTDELRKAKAIINDFFSKPVIFKVKPVFDTESEPAKPAEFQGSTFEQMFKKELDGLKNITEKTDFSLLEAILNEKKLNEFKLRLKEAADNIKSILSNAFEGLSINFGEGIGDIVSGKIENAGSSLIQAIGGLIQELGKALLKYGIIKQGLDKLLGPGGIAIPGGVAIALGISAIAFGQVFKNFAGARATGGPVSGGRSYLIGERGPELFIPQASGTIIPNHNIGGIPGFAQTIEIVGQSRTAGNDILTVWHRATRYNGRNA